MHCCCIVVRNSYCTARKVTKNCFQCFRYRSTSMRTIMADMLKSRLQKFNRPFDRCGIDYAGPFTIRESKRRGRVPTTKAYVAVFVCFVTKALHLELVTSLTSEAFLAVLRRFVSRRGKSSTYIRTMRPTSWVPTVSSRSSLCFWGNRREKLLIN